MDSSGAVAIRSRVQGVIVQPLKQISDHRGAVMHMLRADSPLFRRFGEIYFSLVNPGIVKAWKRHQLITQHLAVPSGRIRLVLYDDRPSSSSKGKVEELILGLPDHYHLVRIPPMIWYGFQGLGETPSLVSNCIDLPYDPEETEGREVSDPSIPFSW